MLFIIIISLVLISLNLLLTYRSKRKRKYGIYPGRISLTLLTTLCVYYLLVIIISNNETPPTLTKTKNKISVNLYQKQLNQYMKSYNEKERTIKTQMKYIKNLYDITIIQGFIAFALSLFGLITIPRRRKFYWITTLSYTVVLSAIFIVNWLFA